MRTRKSFERSIRGAIWKYADLSSSACGHEEGIAEAEQYLVFKVMPLIGEAMETAHEAGMRGVTLEEWSKAKKNLEELHADDEARMQNVARAADENAKKLRDSMPELPKRL